jgi:Na+/H+ antiporter
LFNREASSMHAFESLLILLLAALALAALGRRIGVPYPTLLAVGGALLAFIPNAPRLEVPPDLILALFVAPILLDAAYDTSLRDLRRNWVGVSSLSLIAVVATAVCVAIGSRALIPDVPWGAAIALGALVAPPDAVAALAILRQVNPPHRIRTVLEGESLLNDASALLIYRLAVGAVLAGSFSVIGALPAFALVFLGSVIGGWLTARLVGVIMSRIHDAPSSVILQFVTTFGVWIAAERFHLSGVVTIVVYGLTLARRGNSPMPAQLRVPSFATWETVTFVLNVLAFTLVGLQLGPILDALTTAERFRYLGVAAAILAIVVVVRVAWTMTHHLLHRAIGRQLRRPVDEPARQPTAKDALVVGWSGMRGIVSLAAAMALPVGFPYRDFIQLTAFVVVLGTLLLQGLTLRPLLQLLKFPEDTMLEDELELARRAALEAALLDLEGDHTPAALRLRAEVEAALARVQKGFTQGDTPDNVLRRRVVVASRSAIEELRSTAVIGDTAFRQAEEELDWFELSASGVGGRT